MKMFALALASLFTLNACGDNAGSVDPSRPDYPATEVAKGFMEALKGMDAPALEVLAVDDSKKKVSGIVGELKEKEISLKSYKIGQKTLVTSADGDSAEVKLRSVFLDKSGKEMEDAGFIRMIWKDGKWLIEEVKFFQL